jgi:hypothetical protein
VILGITIAVGIAVLVALFLLGLLAPGISRRRQAAVDRDINKADQRSVRAPAPINGVLDRWLRRFRKAADTSSEAGREVRGE